MLRRILDVLGQNEALTLGELAAATGIAEEALVGMLDTLACQGRIDWQKSATNIPCDRPVAPLVSLKVPGNKTPGRAGGKERVAKTRGR